MKNAPALEDPRSAGSRDQLPRPSAARSDTAEHAGPPPALPPDPASEDSDPHRDPSGGSDTTISPHPGALATPSETAATAKLLGVSVRRPDGEIEVHSMAAARRLLFQDYDPIRQPMAYQGQPSKPGWRYMHRLDSMTSYESKLENRYLMRLDLDPSLVAVVPQPLRLHWRLPGDRKRKHVPDYFVLRNDGTGEIVDVKGSRAADEPNNALVFAVTRRACARLDLRFTIASEVSHARKENYAWLAGYAHLQPQRDLTEALAAAAAAAPISLRELIRTVASKTGVHQLRVKAATFRLLWDRTLTGDLEVPFDSSMLVERTLL